MTHHDIKANQSATRSLMVWTDGYDGQTHYSDVLKALAPAMLILAAAVVLMVVIL